MKILMLSWEYPPKNVGGLSTHVYNLSQALRNQGHEIHVITCEEGTAPIFEEENGVNVHRVSPYNIATDDFTKWVMHLNFAMIEEGIRIIKEFGRFDVIHAHDWLVAYCAKVLKWAYKTPSVATIHATEMGRNGGIRTETQRYISDTEWFLSYEAWKVIACSEYMEDQVKELFKIPDDKVATIPNGVEVKEFNIEFDEIEFKKNYAKEDENIIFFVGRHVFEKGVHLLVDAAHMILQEAPNTKFLIAGQGPMTAELKDKVYQKQLNDKVVFLGYIDSLTKNKLYKIANVAVFPSIYEPFGIVALEAMAAGCPLVVSDTGGLDEIIEHEVNGLKMLTGVANSLKDNVLRILKDKELATNLKDAAYDTIRNQFSWEKVAQLTEEVYNSVKEEAKGTDWDVVEDLKVETSDNDKINKNKKAKISKQSNKAEIEETISLVEDAELINNKQQEVAVEETKKEVKVSARRKTARVKKDEISKTSDAKVEETEIENAKAEPVNVEIVKLEEPKAEIVKVEKQNVEMVKVEKENSEIVKIEEPKVEEIKTAAETKKTTAKPRRTTKTASTKEGEEVKKQAPKRNVRKKES